MADISCIPPECFLPPQQLVPMEYQGWILLGFLGLGIITTIYGIILVMRMPEATQKKRKQK